MIGKILSLLALFVVMQPHFSAAEDQSEGRDFTRATVRAVTELPARETVRPAGKTLPVKPADHTNGKKMSQYSDEHLVTVISKGGASVGKSSQMPAWGAILKETQIQEVVAYIRTLAAAQKDTAKLSGGAK